MIRRLDHVAVAVADTQSALTYFRDSLGLKVIAVDDPPDVPVTLTYLDLGNTWLQLVEPLDAAHPVSLWLAQNGEGLHHICFGVDNVAEELRQLSGPIAHGLVVGSGRGRPAGFPAGEPHHGVRVECTLFDRRADVDGMPGMLGA